MQSLIEPDVLLPEQLGLSGAAAHQPERRLMLAVLEEAVQTVMRYAGDHRVRSQRLVRDVDHWIDARNPDGLFSFAHVCEVLGLDSVAMRRGIRQMMLKSTDRPASRRLSLARRMAGERHRVALSRANRLADSRG